MKHLCEDCLFCNRVVKDNGYKTYCCWRPNELMDNTAEIILGKVKKCAMHTTLGVPLSDRDIEDIENILSYRKFRGERK